MSHPLREPEVVLAMIASLIIGAVITFLLHSVGIV